MTNILYIIIILWILGAPVSAQKMIGDIPLPSSKYTRIPMAEDSFGSWLRLQPLKAAGSDVLDFRDRIYKSGKDSTVAYVMDINISGRRMEQCMDILVRLYTSFLWQSGEQENITFPLPGGYWLDWPDWRDGWRPKFKSIQVAMQHIAQADSSRKNLDTYLRTIYANSHTQQFYHGYVQIAQDEIQIGDFIVLKGSKSHAVLITDLARDSLGNLIALIGHGDTPACQFHLLRYSSQQVWFPLDFNAKVLPLPIRRKMRWTGLRRFGNKKVNEE